MLTQHLCKLPCVYARNAGHMLALKPFGKTLTGIPMRVLLAVVRNDDGACINLIALHECWELVVSECEWRHAVVAYQRIGKGHELTGIGRIGKALGVTHHGSIEYHFSSNRSIVAETLAMKLSSVAKDECYIFHIYFDVLTVYRKCVCTFPRILYLFAE